MIRMHIHYQINRRLGGPKVHVWEFKDPKGIINYITKASLEELQELEEKINYHQETVLFYGVT